MRIRAVSFVAVLVLCGCRDLSFDEGGEGANTAPHVTVVSPKSGDTLPMVWRFVVQAEDADGTASGSISCNGAPIYQWVHGPYEADVDLGKCLKPTDTGVTAITLEAVVTDALGAQSTPVDLTVNVDPTLPKVTADVPARAAPGAELTFPVSSDLPLAAAPTVTVEGVPATVTGDAALQTFTVTFTTPSLTPPAGSALADRLVTERPISIEISATSKNGNVVRLGRTVTVSRVLWEKSVPGVVWGNTQSAGLNTDQLPRGIDVGVWLPLAPEPGSPQMNAWLPAFFHADGRFERPHLPVGAVGRGFGDDGRALVEAGGTTTAITPDGTVAGTGPVLQGALFRLTDRTCAVNYTDLGMCLPENAPVDCVPNTGAPMTVAFPGGVGGYPTHVVRSGNTLLGFDLIGAPLCPNPDGVTTIQIANGLAKLGSLGGAPGPSGPSATRAIPVADTGTFVFQSRDQQGNPPTATSVNGGNAETSYTATLQKIPPENIVAALADGTVVTMFGNTDSTDVALNGPTVTTPVPSFAGLFAFVFDPKVGANTENVVHTPDGGFVYLAKTHEYGRAVVALDANLDIKWIYAYPRGTKDVSLVSDTPSSLLYLVDRDNNWVVALSKAD